MRNGIALAALIVVLLLTGGSLWRLSGNRPTDQVAQAASQTAPLLIQDQTDVPSDTGGDTESDSGAWPDSLTVFPEDGSEVCPNTPLWALLLADGTLSLLLDGVDVTDQARVGPDGAMIFQSALLSPGSHEAAVSITDDSGATQTYTWAFDVAASACPPPPTSGQPGGPPSAPPPGGQTGPALGSLPTQGVLHIVAEHAWLSPQGDTQRSTPTETWLNLATGDARQTEKDSSTGNEVSSTIRTGQTVTRLITPEKRAIIQILPDGNAPQLNEIRETLLGYRGAYDQGRLQFLDEQTVDGLPAIHAQAPAAQGDAGGLEVWLRKDNGLILREIAYRPGAGGSREIAQTHVVNYRSVETLPSVGPDVLQPAIPNDWVKMSSRILTQQMAQGMRDFDLYWLGTEYQGMALVNLSEETISGPPPQGAPAGTPSAPVTFISVAYTQTPNPNAAPPTTPPAGIQIMERKSTGPAGNPGQPGPGGPGGPGGPNQPGGPGGAPPGAEQVTVNGNRATIIQPPPPPTPQPSQAQQGPPPQLPVILDMTTGGTQVTIQGRDRATVLQAAQSLQKLN